MSQLGNMRSETESTRRIQEAFPNLYLTLHSVFMWFPSPPHLLFMPSLNLSVTFLPPASVPQASHLGSPKYLYFSLFLARQSQPLWEVLIDLLGSSMLSCYIVNYIVLVF